MDKYLILIGFIVLVGVAFIALSSGRLATPKIRAKRLMTAREREVFGIIEREAPQCRLHAQVALGALLQLLAGLNQRGRARARNSYSQKIVDYVLEDRATQVGPRRI